jgi:hypothetical protein
MITSFIICMEFFDEEIGSGTDTLLRVQRALEKTGVEFLDDARPFVTLRGRV